MSARISSLVWTAAVMRSLTHVMMTHTHKFTVLCGGSMNKLLTQFFFLITLFEKIDLEL